MATSVGRVLSVNVGTVREFEYRGRPAKSAIWKSPAAGRIAARGINLYGGDQADRKAHSGPDKRCTHTLSKTQGGGNRRSADR
jgi:MOSC domain-containing protein YiiM